MTFLGQKQFFGIVSPLIMLISPYCWMSRLSVMLWFPLQLKKPQMVIKSQKVQKPEAKDGDLTPIKPKTLFDTPENEDDFESEQKPNNNGIFNSSFDADLNVEKIGALDINEQEIKFENEISDLGDNVELPDEEDISQMVNELTLNEKTEAIMVKGI